MARLRYSIDLIINSHITIHDTWYDSRTCLAARKKPEKKKKKTKERLDRFQFLVHRFLVSLCQGSTTLTTSRTTRESEQGKRK